MTKILDFLKIYLKKIDLSFKKIMKGEEDLKTVMWFWGGIAYVFTYLILRKVLKISESEILDLVISSFVIAYFIWHIYALKKCSPKKPKLTKEQKEILKKERMKRISKSFLRKIMLQEPISKWNSASVLIALNLLYIIIFFEYLTR